MSHVETERKYIIVKPSAEDFLSSAEYASSEIEQIYLESESGITHRVRRREYIDRVEYTETQKIRISPVSSIEDEREIGVEEYTALSKEIKNGTRPIRKCRHTFVYRSQLFEIDFYPEWQHCAIMETELGGDDERAEMPPFIKIIKEVTGERAYSNASMSRVFPPEPV